ncbi:unnamed protein product [Onchocerca flexuosa]|uniref:Uncharacterized protein n=1 Tax=Onchocerca flexuosa TaxID=387005 RepID=A0A183I2A3_9BILA|nr:unnamed protein product [Onchocerca flexuosa]
MTRRRHVAYGLCHLSTTRTQHPTTTKCRNGSAKEEVRCIAVTAVAAAITDSRPSHRQSFVHRGEISLLPLTYRRCRVSEGRRRACRLQESTTSACFEHILPAITFTINGSSLPTWRTTNLIMLRSSALTFAPLQGSAAHLIFLTS